MAKVPGPYYPLNRGVDDPPPYSELDATAPPSSISSTTGPLMQTTSSSSTIPAGFIRPNSSDNMLRTRSGAPTGASDAESATQVVTRGVPLASKSIDVVCPHCQNDIRTSIEKRPGVLAYLSGAVMAMLCCFCGCCLIPCCIEECMEVKHTCPNCDGIIGKYRL